MKAFSLLIILSLVAFVSCKKKHEGSIALAKVYDKVLYIEDIKGIVPVGATTADSMNKVKNYIDFWIKKELLIYNADQNLPDDQKDFEKKIEDYKNSLLIYTYKQKIIEQKLDTVVTTNDINSYYKEHKQEFKLINNAIRGLYIKILKTSSDISRINALIIANSKNDSADLDKIVRKSASKFSYFGNDYVYLNHILHDMPVRISDQKDFLQRNKNIEARDSLYCYFLKINDFRLKGDTAPISIVKENLKTIVLNKRKVMLLEELERNIYQNALNNSNLEIFNEKKEK